MALQPPSTHSTSASPAPAHLGTSLRQRHVTMISLGGIIGAGLFVGSSATLSAMGPAACLSYLLAGILVLFVMRMLGEMALANPGIGSFTEYTRIGLGNWAGFTNGWLYWYFWVIVVAVEAVAGAGILQRWIPAPVWAIGLVLLSVMTAINLMSVKSYGEFEYWFASIKVAAIIVFIVVCASYLIGFSSWHDTATHLTGDRGFLPFGAISIFAGVPTVIFAAGGAEASAPERLTLKMWLFPWLSYAVVAAIAGVLVAMGFDRSLASQLLASLGSLAVVSLAYLLTRKRRERAAGDAVRAMEPANAQSRARARPDHARSTRNSASGHSFRTIATHWKK
jgi:L-asparagine transporter-like permease